MISGISGTTLTGGAQYWLIAIGSSTSMAWNFADPEIVGPFAVSIDGGTSWSLVSGLGESAFDVLGTPLSTSVPEPMTAALVGLGLSALAVARRRPARALRERRPLMSGWTWFGKGFFSRGWQTCAMAGKELGRELCANPN
jgi:hypothetical protein